MIARVLHRLYRRSSHIKSLIGRRFSLPGRVLVGAMTLAGIIAVDIHTTVYYQLFCLLAAALIMALLQTWFGYRGEFRARRTTPRLVSANVPFQYDVMLENDGRREVRGVQLVDRIENAPPTVDQFVSRREPGEENRNFFDRATRYYRWMWLVNLQRKAEAEASEPFRLSPGAAIRLTMKLKPLRRGILQLNNLEVRQADLLGLMYRNRRVECPANQIVVLPKRYRLPDVDLAGRARLASGAQLTSSSVGQSDEFLGLREYCPGDPLRHVHWRSWARLRYPVVKEYENESYPRFALVLDTFLGDRSDTVFEEAVSLAASFAASIGTLESMLELLFMGEEAFQFASGGPGGGPATDKMLEILAGVEPASRTTKFSALDTLVRRRTEEVAACVMVFVQWDEARRQLVRNVRATGAVCLPIVVVSEMEPHPDPEVCPLRVARIEEDLWKLEDHVY